MAKKSAEKQTLDPAEQALKFQAQRALDFERFKHGKETEASERRTEEIRQEQENAVATRVSNAPRATEAHDTEVRVERIARETELLRAEAARGEIELERSRLEGEAYRTEKAEYTKKNKEFKDAITAIKAMKDHPVLGQYIDELVGILKELNYHRYDYHYNYNESSAEAYDDVRELLDNYMQKLTGDNYDYNFKN